MLLKQIPYFLMSWMHHMVLMIFFPYFLCPISEIMINWLETSIGKGRRRKLLGNYKLPDNFVLSCLASLPAWTKVSRVANCTEGHKWIPNSLPDSPVSPVDNEMFGLHISPSKRQEDTLWLNKQLLKKFSYY